MRRLFRPLSTVPCSLLILSLLACTPTRDITPVARLNESAGAVVVSATLENRGPSYFNNARFVLTDASGEVDVASWAPLEVAPPLNEKQKMPLTMAAYIGKRLLLRGRMLDGKFMVDQVIEVDSEQ